jgi:hypothetical protein
MQDHPPVQKPSSLLGEGVAATQTDFSNSNNFGYKGMAFIGEFGTAAPLIHTFAQITTPLPGFTPTITGQKVVVIDPRTGNYTDFVSLKRIDKRFHPTGVKFDLKGDAMYIADFGKAEIRTSNPASGSGTDKLAFGAGLYPFASIHATVWSYANTGVIWKVTKVGGNAAAESTSSSTPALKTNVTSSSLQKVTPSATIANKTSNQANANKSTIAASNNNTTIPSPIGIPGIP